MDSLACEVVAPGPALGLTPLAATRPRRLAIAFQADKPRGRERRRFELGRAIALPAYSRIVYRDGAAHVR